MNIAVPGMRAVTGALAATTSDIDVLVDRVEMLIAYALVGGMRLAITIGSKQARLDDMPLVRHG